jgi:hypothetical protein
VTDIKGDGTGDQVYAAGAGGGVKTNVDALTTSSNSTLYEDGAFSRWPPKPNRMAERILSW